MSAADHRNATPRPGEDLHVVCDQRQPSVLEAVPEDADGEIRREQLENRHHRLDCLAFSIDAVARLGNALSIQFGPFSGMLRADPEALRGALCSMAVSGDGDMRPIQNPPNPFESVEREWLEEPPDVQ